MTAAENSLESLDPNPVEKAKLVKTPWFFKQLLLANDPVKFVREVAKLGDFVQVRGLVNFYFINHPDLIKQVLKTDNDNINRDNIIYNRLQNVSRTGLVTSEGEYWKKQRRTMNPLFTPRAVKTFANKMSAAAQTRLEQWNNFADSGEAFDVADEMDRLTLEINGSCLFNANLRHVYDDLQVWFNFINRYMEMIPYPIFTRPGFPSPSNFKLKRTLKKVDAYIDTLIEERRQNLEEYDDFLSVLMRARDEETGEGLSDEALRHEILVFFIAGYETASTALCWSWYHLQQHPHVEEKMLEEIQSVLGDREVTLEDVPNLKYTRMFVEEVLRVTPSAWLTGKATINEQELFGHKVPGKSMLIITPPTIHEHPDFWDEPEKFEPLRFDEAKSSKRHPFAYVPFGGGPHVCIGKHFAIMEIVISLAVLVRNFKVDVQPGFVPDVAAGIAMSPKNPLMVKVSKRNP